MGKNARITQLEQQMVSMERLTAYATLPPEAILRFDP